MHAGGAIERIHNNNNIRRQQKQHDVGLRQDDPEQQQDSFLFLKQKNPTYGILKTICRALFNSKANPAYFIWNNNSRPASYHITLEKSFLLRKEEKEGDTISIISLKYLI